MVLKNNNISPCFVIIDAFYGAVTVIPCDVGEVGGGKKKCLVARCDELNGRATGSRAQIGKFEARCAHFSANVKYTVGIREGKQKK